MPRPAAREGRLLRKSGFPWSGGVAGAIEGLFSFFSFTIHMLYTESLEHLCVLFMICPPCRCGERRIQDERENGDQQFV